MNDERSPLSNDGRGLIGIIAVLLAALLWFGVPPAYVQVGPVEAGELVNTTCHGIAAGGTIVFKVCK